MSEETKVPSAVRLQRIDAVIQETKAFKRLLGEKTLEVVNRRGKKLKFDPRVADIASQMVAEGNDPASCKKSLIIAKIEAVFNCTAEPAATQAEGQAAPAAAAAAAAVDKAEGAGPRLGDDNNPPILPALNLALAIRQLLNLDRKPGADERKKLIGSFIDNCTANLG